MTYNNSHIQKNKINLNKNIKTNVSVKKVFTIKKNYNDSRNMKLDKNNSIFDKFNSNKIENILSNTHILGQNDYSKNNSKSKKNSQTNSLFELKNKINIKDIYYKKIEPQKRKIKDNILYNGFKICNSSRNKENIMSKKTSFKDLANSKGKIISNKINKLIKIGIKKSLNKTSNSKNKNKKINNFSKLISTFKNKS